MFKYIKAALKVAMGRHTPTIEEVSQKPERDAYHHFENVNFDLLALQAQVNKRSPTVMVENLEGGRAKVEWIKKGVIITAE